MSIYKKIDNKDIAVAKKTIIYHDDLQGRNNYGAHPISAIRKLPEKITQLSNAISQNATDIIEEKTIRTAADNTLQSNINTVQSNVTTVATNAAGIDMEENAQSGTFTFTNYNGEQKTIQGGYLPDNNSIVLEDNKLVAKGIKTTQNELISADTIKNNFTTINNNITAIQSVDNTQNNQIANLQNITKGMGGYLDSYNFQTATPTQTQITDYALQDIGITDANDIWDGTKVINLYNNDVWSFDLAAYKAGSVNYWSNLGQFTFITDANNDGVHGLVTGSYDDLEGYIDINGHITLNGLSESLQTINTNITNIQSEQTTQNTNIQINTSNIASEISNRELADSNLQSQVTSNSNSISTLNNEVGDLTTRVTSDESSISTNTSNISTNTSNINNLSSNLTDEISNRQAADNTLQQNISANTSAIASNTSTIEELSTSKQDKSNKVTSLSSNSTDTQYPSAKCVYDIVGNIVSLMEVL